MCTYGETLEELLKRPTDLLVLVGADGESDDDSDDDNDESEEDEDEESDDEDEGDDDDSDDDSSDSDKSKKKKAKQKPSDEDDQIATLESEVERHKKRRAAAEERVTRLLDEVKQLKASGTKDEDLKKQVNDTTAQNQQLSSEVERLRLDNAFLRSNKFEWADPSAALKLVDMSDVEIDDKGEVQGLEAALQSLAKKSPFLLKVKTPAKPAPVDKTGTAGGSRRKPDAAKAKAREQDLLERYPGLRR